MHHAPAPAQVEFQFFYRFDNFIGRRHVSSLTVSKVNPKISGVRVSFIFGLSWFIPGLHCACLLKYGGGRNMMYRISGTLASDILAFISRKKEFGLDIESVGIK